MGLPTAHNRVELLPDVVDGYGMPAVRIHDRPGEDPKTSVTNPQCRLHEVDNLYWADASIFPTGAGVNLTLTLQANALRVGDWIARNHRHI